MRNLKKVFTNRPILVVFLSILFLLPFLLFFLLNVLDKKKSNVLSVSTNISIIDLNNSSTGSFPYNFGTMNNILYFTTGSEVYGRELWRSNGTLSGTYMIKDIYNGSTGSSPSSSVTTGSILYFVAEDGIHGRELWKSDGTEQGTVIVKDIYPGISSSSPLYLKSIEDTVYFQATDGVHGIELWKSDGTEEGTRMVKDIYTGSFSGWPFHLVSMNNILYFKASDGINGDELWRSDGTEEGTIMVKDVCSTGGSSINHSTVIDGNLYFSATSDGNPTKSEPWKSDGTTAGTYLIKDINSLTGGSMPIYFTKMGTHVYFQANDGINGPGLWKTDGTSSGTVMVKYVNTPSGFTLFGDTLFFGAQDNTHGRELWKTDGTEEGTVLVKDIYSGTEAGSPGQLKVINNTLYFTANDGINGIELWESDGTEGGTALFKDINSGAGSSSPNYLTLINNLLYFSCDDGLKGNELCILNFDSSAPIITLNPNPTTNNTPSFSGNATDSDSYISTVQYQIDATSGTWTNCTASDGAFDELSENFTCSISTALSTKSHTIYFRATDSNGNISNPLAYNFTVVVQIEKVRITDIGSMSSILDKDYLFYYFISNKPLIKGLAPLNTTVKFVVTDKTFSSVVGSDGKFEITLDLENGNNKIIYYAQDSNGNKSANRELNLVIGSENFPDWLLEQLGLVTNDTREEDKQEQVETKTEEPQVEETTEEVTETPKVEAKVLKFLDKEGKPMSDAEIVIEEKSYYTNSKGEIRVSGLDTTKTYTAKITHNGVEYEAEVLGLSDTEEIVAIEITDENIKEDKSWLQIGILVSVGLLILSIIFLVIYKKRKSTIL